MKEIAILVAIMQFIGSMGVVLYTLDVTNDFYNKYDDVKNGDTEALTEFMENRAKDLVNLTIDEIKDTPRDILIDELLDER